MSAMVASATRSSCDSTRFSLPPSARTRARASLNATPTAARSLSGYSHPGRFGFSTHGAELVHDGDTPLSATYARRCVAAGDMRAASAVLGRPHRVDGVVERGDQRGRELGYPTANLRTEQWAAVPADGVYAGRAVLLDQYGATVERPPLGPAAVSVGTNPTFDGTQRRVEAHILDFDEDLYGARIGVEFTRRLRGQERYESLDALIGQMRADVGETRRLVR